jgi:acetyl esterase/lipase
MFRPAAAAVFVLLPPALVRAEEPAAAKEPPARTFEVESHRDIAYYKGDDADPVRHRLDVFVPKGHKDYPVVLLVHGGAWMFGDKSCVGLYTSVGKFLARQGIGAVLPNYRLSPQVKHPEHVKDVARAFAWTHENIGKYGGRADRIFVAGHSAGAHLVALLATDETYLKAEGLSTSDIRGVIPVSGVYRIPALDREPGRGDGAEKVLLKGDTAALFPGLNTAMAHDERVGRVVTWLVGLYTPVFGDDPEVRCGASPVCHVRKGLPPFLIFYADSNLPTLPKMAEEFSEALRDSGCDVELVKVKKRTHNTILFSAVTADDPVARAVLEFVGKHAR